MFNHRSAQLAFLDQGIVSCANLLTGIIIVRGLGPESFGIYMLLMMYMYMVNTLQLSGIVSPLLSLTPKLDKDETPEYLGAVLTMQLIVTMGSSLVFIGAIFLMSSMKADTQLADYCIPALFALVGLQLQDFARRFYFALRRSGCAVINDSISYIGQLAIIGCLLLMGTLTTELVFLTMTATSLIAFLVWVPESGKLSFTGAALRKYGLQHWHFSKWLMVSMGSKWLSGNVSILVAALYLSVAEIGAIGAALRILGPVMLLYMALENYMPVEASHILHNRGWSHTITFAARVGILGALFTAVLCTMTVFWATELLHLFYGDAYLSYDNLVAWYAVTAFLMFLSRPVISILRAAEITQPFAAINGWVAVFAIVTSFPLVIMWGQSGVMFGLALNELLVSTGFIVVLINVNRRMSVEAI